MGTPISVHGDLHADCSHVKKGTVLRLFNDHCKYKLHTYPLPVPAQVNPVKRKVPHAGLKTTYKNQELTDHILVCETDPVLRPFAKKRFMFRLDVRRITKCPIKKIIADFEYAESTNAVNGVSSGIQHMEVDWPEGATSRSFSMATPTIGDPFTFGSSGAALASASVSFEDSDVDNSCANSGFLVEVILDSMGMAVDQWYSDPGLRSGTKGCNDFINGNGVPSFWTGANFSHGAIGLVMNFFYNIYGAQ